MPDEADIRGVNTCANKHVKVLMNDILELKHTKQNDSIHVHKCLASVLRRLFSNVSTEMTYMRNDFMAVRKTYRVVRNRTLQPESK